MYCTGSSYSLFVTILFFVTDVEQYSFMRLQYNISISLVLRFTYLYIKPHNVRRLQTIVMTRNNVIVQIKHSFFFKVVRNTY